MASQDLYFAQRSEDVIAWRLSLFLSLSFFLEIYSDRETLPVALAGRERLVQPPRHHPLDVQTADPVSIFGVGLVWAAGTPSYSFSPCSSTRCLHCDPPPPHLSVLGGVSPICPFLHPGIHAFEGGRGALSGLVPHQGEVLAITLQDLSHCVLALNMRPFAAKPCDKMLHSNAYTIALVRQRNP